mgnify:CR=1 FL=1
MLIKCIKSFYPVDSSFPIIEGEVFELQSSLEELIFVSVDEESLDPFTEYTFTKDQLRNFRLIKGR